MCSKIHGDWSENRKWEALVRVGKNSHHPAGFCSFTARGKDNPMPQRGENLMNDTRSKIIEKKKSPKN